MVDDERNNDEKAPSSRLLEVGPGVLPYARGRCPDQPRPGRTAEQNPEGHSRSRAAAGTELSSLPAQRRGLRLRPRRTARTRSANRQPPPQGPLRGRRTRTRETRHLGPLPPTRRPAARYPPGPHLRRLPAPRTSLTA